MVGREEEVKTLAHACRSRESQFIAVYGRRRVGKTYLIRNNFSNRFAFCHTGIFNAPYSEQLEEFRQSLIEYGDRQCPKLENWRDAFSRLKNLLEASTDEKKIVFIDELPWMETRNSGFIAQIEKFWNKWASARNDVVFIVCGSAASWMVKNIIADCGGLHNRITDSIAVHPFTLKECAQYAVELGLDMSMRELAETYMVFGGVPYYWSLLQKDRSLAQNLDRLLFAPHGKLRGEFDRMFKSLFRSDAMHSKIVAALSRKKAGKTRDEILAEVTFTDGGNFSEALRALEECGFVRPFVPSGKTKKNTVYQLVDNFTLFHHEFLSGKIPPDEHFWSSSVTSPIVTNWKGRAFERLCLTHVANVKAALGIAGVRTAVHSWAAPPADKTGGKGAQIDMLIDRADGVVNLCEMKYSDGEYNLTPAELNKMETRKEIFRSTTKTRKSVHLTLITPHGVADSPSRHHVQSEVTLKDLFA